MPTYQYTCTACGHELEAVQSFSDDPLTVCPECAGRLRKVFSAVGVVFKGSGFYRTDSRAGNGKSGSGSGDSGSGEGSGEGAAKSGASKDSKEKTSANSNSSSGSSASGSSGSGSSGSGGAKTTAATK